MQRSRLAYKFLRLPDIHHVRKPEKRHTKALACDRFTSQGTRGASLGHARSVNWARIVISTRKGKNALGKRESLGETIGLTCGVPVGQL
jgi:hypothetical protein